MSNLNQTPTNIELIKKFLDQTLEIYKTEVEIDDMSALSTYYFGRASGLRAALSLIGTYDDYSFYSKEIEKIRNRGGSNATSA